MMFVWTLSDVLAAAVLVLFAGVMLSGLVYLVVQDAIDRVKGWWSGR
jgi:hypothetical protein